MHDPSEYTLEEIRSALDPHVRARFWNEYHPYGSTVAAQPMAESEVDVAEITVVLLLEDEFIPTQLTIEVNDVPLWLTLEKCEKHKGDWKCTFKVELSE